MRRKSLWSRLLDVEGATIKKVRFDHDEGRLVAEAKPHSRERGLCGECRQRCPGYDSGEGKRWWRALDLGIIPAYVEADAPRVLCPEHGVIVAAVPWARHGARFTRSFEDQSAWMATHASRTSVSGLMRVTWRTVGSIITRVAAETAAAVDRFSGLRRIGIDEISYRKGHRYLTVVVDHDQGRLLWAKAGHDSATLDQFFELLGPKRCARIEMVSADAAGWIRKAVENHCPNAQLCLDPFHVVSWATDALDEVRREIWNEARSGGNTDEAKELKGARFALWKNPRNLTRTQRKTLASIAETNGPLYRAYLLKEHLRLVFKLKGKRGKRLLNEWLQWARRCRIPAFVGLAKKIHREHRTGIDNVLDTGLSNALVESMNCKIRVLTRQAFGFRTPEALVAMAMLALGGLCPDLPGRS